MKQEIQLFLEILYELQKIHSEFPIQYAICLGEIAQTPGISLTELSLRTGMPLSTTSRIISVLSQDKPNKKFYGYVVVKIVPNEKRKKQIFLSKSGENTIEKIRTTISAKN